MMQNKIDGALKVTAHPKASEKGPPEGTNRSCTLFVSVLTNLHSFFICTITLSAFLNY